ncbi:Peptidyl-tRNA hydrolase [hydrothermal vent metagenome]|uniref:peptidyl-tRNA hydrolase n=1 Tax=hydrothermal vent metagenome TaxID=652676 RepID=A0A3B0SG16_9ZZZZ
MWLIAGLGNPESNYLGNRHNAGFMVIDAIAEHFGPVAWRSKFGGQLAEIVVDTEQGRSKILLLKPATFYNESGRAVRAAMDFHKLNPEQICVFHDELALEPGKFRTKFGGGAAGNNGIKSIIATLGPDFWRCRIGIGHPGDKTKVTPYVLRNFSKFDQSWFAELTEAITRALPLFLAGQTDAFQTRVTHLAPAPDKQGPK